MLIDGGGGGSMYAVQIESLETFQQRLTTILQSLEQDNTVMSMNDGSSCFGDFPEGQSFAAAYEQTKQDLINSFNEVTQLVNTMINVVGTSANKYRETEQEITTKFNAILQQYGDTPTPPPTTTYSPGSTSGTGTSGTTYYPQNTGTTYATQQAPQTPQTVDGSGSGNENGTGSGTGSSDGSGSGTDTNTGSSSNSGGDSNSNTSAGAA